jgi:hypothetical protein
LYVDAEGITVSLNEPPMPLSESEARRRRILAREAFRFMNARVLDRTPFKRAEMFGPETVGKGAMVDWSRRVINRLIDRGKIVVSESGTRPVYQAIEVVKVTEEEISKYLKYSDDEDLPAPQDIPAPVVRASVFEEDVTPAPQPAEEREVEDAGEPDVRRMLASLVSILPDLVKAVNRIEKKAVGIEVVLKSMDATLKTLEAGQKKIDEDMTYLHGLIEEKK